LKVSARLKHEISVILTQSRLFQSLSSLADMTGIKRNLLRSHLNFLDTSRSGPLARHTSNL